MFREMRRKGQQLSAEECIEILNRGTSGVLALEGDDGYPYAVPLSYVYEDGRSEKKELRRDFYRPTDVKILMIAD